MREHEVQSKFKNKCDLTTLDAGGQDDLVTERKNVVDCASRIAAVLQKEATIFPGCCFMQLVT